MDKTVLKIAIAAFMHDIGKLADRIALSITNQFINDHADLYQPFYHGRHTHVHAVYTAAFIEYLADLLPEEFNSPRWGEGDAFINIAAGHHRPDTPMQWIVAMADRVSSGWDRENFDKEYNYKVPWKDYKKTRLVTLFEQLMRDQGNNKNKSGQFSYCYPLEVASARNIFPRLKSDIVPEGIEASEEEYKALFSGFKAAMGSLLHKEENLELWFENLNSLMMIYTSGIPAARAGDVIPDVSLYDHSRTTAALAAAIYLYHKHTDSFAIEAIKNYEDKKFLIIIGNFYGIQDFIFSSHGETRKNRSKLLRGRSFAISLFCELAADMVCREIGIPFSSVALNAAGKFTIMAPNTTEAKKAVYTVEDRVNDWLTKVSCGQSALGLSVEEASASDFVAGSFFDLWENLKETLERKKFTRIDLNKRGGPIKGYLDGFSSELSHPLCPFCGKRPSSPEVEGAAILGEDKSACKVCRDHIFLGTNLVKKNRLAITTREAEIKGKGNKLIEPIFNHYQVGFPAGDLKDMARNGRLLRHWDLTIDEEGRVPQDVAARFINGYVPVYEEEDQHDERVLAGAKSEANTLELIDQIQLGEPKTLGHIAAKAMNPTGKEGIYCGIEALGILKADVDRLGLLMACGLPPKRFTLSRLATLSRQLDHYFTIYLPHLLRTNTQFKEVYTVFAGGDDLFVIGPWNRIIDLVRSLKDSFAHYVCKNEAVHFSAGISLHKPHTPLDQLSDTAETALEQSKAAGRNRLTLFGETVTWGAMDRLTEIKETLHAWLELKWINNAMLYRLNDFIDLAGEEHRVVSDDEIHIDDLSCTKWRSMIVYYTERNVAKEIKGEKRRDVIDKVASMIACWLMEYGDGLRMPLWEYLYNQR